MISKINNYTYKKLRIIQSYPQPFLKASTNSHRLRNLALYQKAWWTDAQTSPRLWNLYLALSKGLTAKKIELYGVFYFPPRHCYKGLVLCRYIYNCLCCQRGRVEGGSSDFYFEIIRNCRNQWSSLMPDFVKIYSKLINNTVSKVTI